MKATLLTNAAKMNGVLRAALVEVGGLPVGLVGALGVEAGAGAGAAPSSSVRLHAQVACKHTQLSPIPSTSTQPQIAEYDPPDSHSE